jgi:phosphomannomutase
VLDTTSRAATQYLRQALSGSRCELLETRTGTNASVQQTRPAHHTPTSSAATPFYRQRLAGLGNQVRGAAAHFGLWIDGNGETAHVVDERGRAIAAERILVLLARFLIEQHPAARVVVESDATPQLRDQLTALGAGAVSGGATREQMYAAMLESQALLGGGPSGRVWFLAETPLADALLVLSLLLTILSQSDQPLSAVLDDACRDG